MDSEDLIAIIICTTIISIITLTILFVSNVFDTDAAQCEDVCEDLYAKSFADAELKIQYLQERQACVLECIELIGEE